MDKPTQIKIGATKVNETAYDKHMSITGMDGVEVRLILHWDENDGYEFTWLDKENRFISAPSWAENFEGEYERSLGIFLDNLHPHTLVTL
jgi:hypothetical protein